MAKTKIAINGFGRIGRSFFRVAYERPELDIIAVNDLGNPQNLAYLLTYDSAYGRAPFKIEVGSQNNKPVFVLDGKKTIFFTSQKEPRLLPWKELGVDIVIEASGVFDDFEKSKPHLQAGAKRVVITAPVKDEPIGIQGGTVLMGVNEEKLKTCDISSNASCTTNAASPLIAILHENIGIYKALLNTTHSYTATQSLVDGAVKDHDFRRGRAAAHNIIPSHTGAAIAVTKAFPALDGLFDGIAIRVPTITGSITDITFLAKRDVTAEEVNNILRKAADEERWKRVFAVTEEPIVSSDIVGSKYASIADLSFTRVVGGNLVKVIAWYDNEMGYTYSLVEHVIKSGQYLLEDQK